MASTSLRIALLAGLGLLVVPIVSDAAPSRGTPRATSRPAAAKAARSGRATKPLSSAKRLARVNGLLAALGQETQDELPPVVDGVTPVRPALDDNRAIRWHRGGYFLGRNNYVESGRIYVYSKTFPSMEIGWATEAGKVHVIDCAVEGRYPVDGQHRTVDAKIRFRVEDVGEATVQAVDGHALHAFVAEDQYTIFELGYVDRDDLPSYYLGWYGCSVTPLDP
jgi:hypothetical protein